MLISNPPKRCTSSTMLRNRNTMPDEPDDEPREYGLDASNLIHSLSKLSKDEKKTARYLVQYLLDHAESGIMPARIRDLSIDHKDMGWSLIDAMRDTCICSEWDQQGCSIMDISLGFASCYVPQKIESFKHWCKQALRVL